jgi:hypothetical protein
MGGEKGEGLPLLHAALGSKIKLRASEAEKLLNS